MLNEASEIIKSELYTECECAGCCVEPIKQKEKHGQIGRKGSGKRKRDSGRS